VKTIVAITGIGSACLAAGAAWSISIVNNQAEDKIASLAQEATYTKGDPERGEYVAKMGGCIACHTDTENGGDALAGGVPIVTPFGTFYSPNITSDKMAGIGAWSDDDFINALSLGLSPTGDHYFPAFPYTSYSVMEKQDMVDLKAWINTVEPVSDEATEHQVAWPFSLRPPLAVWKAMYFDPTRQIADGNRGEYLVNGPTHCTECHSPRNPLGGLSTLALSGNQRGPDGHAVPGITASDLAEWTKEDIELFLEVGITLSGDFTGGHMTDVVEYSTSQLTMDDRSAIADYLLSDANQP
jgi:mono/diheme cytochrome c family protein